MSTFTVQILHAHIEEVNFEGITQWPTVKVVHAALNCADTHDYDLFFCVAENWRETQIENPCMCKMMSATQSKLIGDGLCQKSTYPHTNQQAETQATS